MGRKDNNIQDDGTRLIGSHMRLARQNKSLSLTEMARRVVYTVPYLSAIENGNGRPSRQLVEMYERELELNPGELMEIFERVEQNAPPLKVSSDESHPREDWGEAPDVPDFFGREAELFDLTRSILDDKCRIVAVLGNGGVGKTSLVYRWARQTQQQFDYIFWRSLQSMPRLEELLKTCILFLSNRAETDLSHSNEENLIFLLINYLRKYRCLLILDNFESLFLESNRVGEYRANYDGYGKLLRRIGESSHQSCLLLTSREKPRQMLSLEGTPTLARSLSLSGIGEREAQNLLREKHLIGSEKDWSELVKLYSGNPFSLKLISEPIREVFEGDIAVFLLHGEAVFGDIQDLLAQQIRRLTTWESEILYWLAIERVALTLQDLLKNIVRPVPKGALPEALASLQRRSMVIKLERGSFTLHPVVMEYVTSDFVERVFQEIINEALDIFDHYPLMKAQSKDYIRETQKRLILEPLAHHLLAHLGQRGSEEKLQTIVSQLQKTRRRAPGYPSGNLLNLLVQLQVNLRGWDFSHLVVRQAYLRGVALPEVDFSFADLDTTAFTETFGSILAVAFSHNGQILAAGTVTGEIRTWQVSHTTPFITFQGHTNWVWSVAFSPDGQTLASGSEDGTVRLWNVSSGDCFRILENQGGQVYTVAFSPDGQSLASGSKNGTVSIWEVSSGTCLMTLTGHKDSVYSVAFSPDGQWLASGSEDETVRLWKVKSSDFFLALEGQGGQVYTVAFSRDGRLLASGSEDGAIRLWEVNTGQQLNTLKEHSNRIYAVAFNPGEQMLLASGSNDQTVRLWDINTEQCLDTLYGYTNLVWSIAFSAQGKLLVSGSNDQAVRLWDIDSRACLGTLQGHSDRVRSVAFSPDGQTVASGSEDKTVYLWEASTGHVRFVLQGHSDNVRSVAFSPDSQLLASGSEDGTVCLWDVNTGQLFSVLEAQGSQVYTVAFSPDGQMVAGGSEDGTVCLWDANTGRYSTLYGHSNKIYAVAFSPDGNILASGSNDQTVKLWAVNSGQCLATLSGHSNRIYALAFSPDGSLLASGSNDQTVRLWEINTRQHFATLEGPNIWVYSVAFSPDGRVLAIGGYEGTITMWDVQARQFQKPFKSEKPYERMNITGAVGLMPSQRSMLRTLGAIESTKSIIADRQTEI